jgi:phosphoribosylformimino-5-aminoimidazole carboxamide ribotide isomerase
VAIRGWTETGELTVVDLGRRARDAGAVALLYTDVSRDGTGLGPNVEATAALVLAVGLPVLASGGVATVDDLVRLAAVPGVLGTVVGRALYTGAIELRHALDALAEPPLSAAGCPPASRHPLQ